MGAYLNAGFYGEILKIMINKKRYDTQCHIN